MTPPAALSIPVVRNSTDLINVLVRIGRQHPRRWALEDIQLAMKPAAHQSFQAMPEERRRSPRHPLGRVAAIMFGRGEEHPCLVKDYSDGGVRLQLTGFEIPDNFELLFAPKELASSGCYKVVWRLGTDVGAKFIGPATRNIRR